MYFMIQLSNCKLFLLENNDRLTDGLNCTNGLNWTFELEKIVYRCYVCNDESIGYMKQLKSLWDKMHLEYNFLSDKNLRDQASKVHENNVIMDTEYRKTAAPINRNDNL